MLFLSLSLLAVKCHIKNGGLCSVIAALSVFHSDYWASPTLSMQMVNCLYICIHVWMVQFTLHVGQASHLCMLKTWYNEGSRQKGWTMAANATRSWKRWGKGGTSSNRENYQQLNSMCFVVWHQQEYSVCRGISLWDTEPEKKVNLQLKHLSIKILKSMPTSFFVFRQIVPVLMWDASEKNPTPKFFNDAQNSVVDQQGRWRESWSTLPSEE